MDHETYLKHYKDAWETRRNTNQCTIHKVTAQARIGRGYVFNVHQLIWPKIELFILTCRTN